MEETLRYANGEEPNPLACSPGFQINTELLIRELSRQFSSILKKAVTILDLLSVLPSFHPTVVLSFYPVIP